MRVSGRITVDEIEYKIRKGNYTDEDFRSDLAEAFDISDADIEPYVWASADRRSGNLGRYKLIENYTEMCEIVDVVKVLMEGKYAATE